DTKFINQCLLLAARWQQVGPEAIGLSEADRAAFAALGAQVHADARQAAAMRLAAKGATVTKNASLKKLRARFGALTRRIEGFALTSANPAQVFADAQIGAGDTPSPLPAPDAPVAIGATLRGDGSAMVVFAGRFEGANMEVQRAVNVAGGPFAQFHHLGVFNDGSFIDLYPPQGALSVWYRARIVRGTGKASAWSGSLATLTFGRARPDAAGELVRAA
ncbi:MAG: hypothetical protein ACIAQU_08900, partial [Phycisphaerales bacterium JB064]